MLSILMLAALLQAPDTAYFQQGVAYRIEARLDETAQVLNGRLRMRYLNRSRRQLDTLWFHLHLNAFRPHSAWAARDQEQGEVRFQNLGPEQHAFERVRRVALGERTVVPHFPLAPDSTVMAVPLAAPLLPGDSVVVAMDWDARPATLPRRQGRRGRQWDFAQWYPRIAAYDRDGWQVQPLLPQGEFYGEFAEYDITLEVADDQVIGATGVPVGGDPGWARVAAVAGTTPDYRRAAYPAREPETLGLLDQHPARGYRQVRWRAQDVHHFAWSSSPEYRYEGGAYEDVAIHVLYLPGDTAWDDGAAVRNTVTALAWYDTVFGDFAWPQLTNLHRIEGGGTEFPMVIMNGSASLGLILHEAGHNYVHGILANNEWREGWLDEGFSSFLTNLYFHEQSGRPTWRRGVEMLRRFEATQSVQPVDLPGAEYATEQAYGAMTYGKAEAVFWMLRDVMGAEPMRQALRYYYEQNRLRHVREEDLRAAMERFHPAGLRWFFHQWLHTTDRLDYGLGVVAVKQRGDGQWEVRVEVLRTGEAWMPVTLQLDGERYRLESPDARQWVTLVTASRPQQVTLDPDGVLLETDVANNARALPPGGP